LGFLGRTGDILAASSGGNNGVRHRNEIGAKDERRGIQVKNVNGKQLSRRRFLQLAAAGSGCALTGFNAMAADTTESVDKRDVIETLFDGKNASEWSTSRDAARLDREFAASKVEETSDAKALRWFFTPREGTTFNDLWLGKPISQPFTSIQLLIKNDGAPLNLAAKVVDADGAEWTTDRMALPADSEWRRISFPYKDWKAASWSSDPDGRLDFPLSSFVIIAYDLVSGQQYDIKVARVEIIRPAPPTALIHHFSIPDRMFYGKSYRASIQFQLDKPCHWGAAYLLFIRNGKLLFRTSIPLPAPMVQIPAHQTISIPNFPVHIPEYAYGGKYIVGVELGEAKARWSGLPHKEPEVNIHSRSSKKTSAIVNMWNGVPTLFLNKKPQNSIVYMAYVPSEKVFRQFADSDVRIFSFSGTPTASNYGLAKTAWIAPGKYDFSQLDERIMMVLQANPNAYFFPRLYLDAPSWWLESHPEDVVLMDPGDGKYTPFISSGSNQQAPSWASEAWRAATIEGLRHLIEHIESSPFADRCIGYHLTSGTTEEWMMWGANENDWVDYSHANTVKFQRWLREKYQTISALRASWHNASITFETTTIPPKTQREQCDFGSLRDPAKEQAVIDFYLYNSEMTADTIETFAHAVKKMTNREKIVGVFYGYLLQLCGEQRQQNAGHLALEKVISSPDVDFLCSPTSYAFRELGGEGTSHFMSLLGSIHLHGKMWFDENDIRTSVSGGYVGEWGRPKDVAGDILQQSKELANAIVNGTGQWWFDVGANRYDNPDLMKEIKALTNNATLALKLNRTPIDETAMIVDERSLCYLRVGDPLGAWLLVSQLPSLLRIGAPVGEYLVTDIPRINNRKLFLFMTSFAPTDTDRQSIESLKSKRRVLVFFYAPGLYKEEKITTEAMHNLTGMKLSLSTEPAMLQAILNDSHPLTRGLGGAKVGIESSTFPICYCDDPEAKTLASFANGRPAITVKEFPEWTSVFSSVPLLPTEFLRRLADAAGVHEYIQTPDVVWASRDMLAVCVNKLGRRKISLPQRVNVKELYSGSVIGKGIDTFEIDFEPQETMLFALEHEP
jgi:hypothetical protein